MRFADVRQGMIHLSDELKDLIQVDRIIIESAIRTVSWRGRRPGIKSNVYYPMEYQFLLDTHQYSLLLIDQSFFQFFYEFDDANCLCAARLAYYPTPIRLDVTHDELVEGADSALAREDNFLFEHLYNLAEFMEMKNVSPVNTSHVRFDYDAGCKTHEPAHIQYGGLNDLRLPADFVPQPLAFVELVATLLPNKEDFTAARLGHARNNCLAIQRCEKIIVLGHL